MLRRTAAAEKRGGESYAFQQEQGHRLYHALGVRLRAHDGVRAPRGRSAVHTEIAVPHSGRSRGRGEGNLPLLILRSTCGTLGIFCNYYAIDHLVLADANILNKMSPFFAILFSLFLLKERANIWQYLSVLAAFGGAMLIIKPGFSADAFPAVIGLLGGMGAGAAYTFVRALSKRKEKSARIVFFFSAFSSLTALPFVIADFHPMTFAQFMCLMGAGAAATLGQFGVTLAYLHAPAKEISVFDYTQVLFSAALGFFMFGQIPDGLSVLGYIVICGVSVAMFCYNRHLDAGEKA